MNGAGPTLSTIAGAIYLLILSPIVIVFILAFSADTFMVFPPSGYSLRWFGELFSNRALINALLLSLQIAPVVTMLSLLVGVPAALALEKTSFPGKEAVRNFFLAPLLLGLRGHFCINTR